ncbi:MAG: NmrA family NAD(P)-binding protein [Hyphomonadaceae bacterium]
MRTVGVIGATGRQGLAQIRQLTNSGYQVRALSRSEAPTFFGIDGHVDSRVFDLENEATLLPALQGCDALFYTHPLRMKDDRVAHVTKVAAACKTAGVARIVHNTSSWIPDKPGDPHTYGRNTASIQALWSSGVPSTVFGPVLFMDNLLTDWARPYLIKERRYIYPHAPEIGASWISLDDVGKIMVASLSRPDLVGAWMNIGGPEQLRGPEVAKILSEVLGYELSYDPCSAESFGDLLVDAMGASLPTSQKQSFAESIAAFYRFNNESPAQPFSVNSDYMLERLPEIELETLSEWAKRQDWSDHEGRPSAG